MRVQISSMMALAVAASSAAAAPLVIPHTGLLLDASDVPVAGPTVRVQFGIHATATGGSPLWSSQTCTVPVRAGRFATTLGDTCPGAAPLDESVVPPGTPRWIELTVEGVTLLPRLQVSSVPSASVALRSLDTEALRSKLSSSGALNATDNPVDWTQLKNVPADVAAGGNYSAGGGLQLVGKQFSVASGGIGTAHLAAGAITNAQIALGTITADRFAGGIPLSATTGSLDAARLTGTIVNSQIASGAITNAQIALGTITADRFAGGIPLSATTGSLDASRLTGSLPAGMVPTGTRLERTTTRTTCAAADLGMMYLNSDDDQVYVCGVSGWKKVSQRPGVLRWAETAWTIGPVYETAASRTFTLHNDGDMAVSGLQFTFPANLVQQSTTCGASLAGASTCTLTVATAHPGIASAITGNVAASGSGTSTTLTVSGQFQTPTSCKFIKTSNPAAADGTYSIDPDGAGAGAAYDVFCDMSVDGGGWTTFFAGTNGQSNVFARFEQTGLDCTNPASRCLRRIPSTVTTSTELAVRCGSAVVKFMASSEAIAYLRDGTQGAWRNLSGAVAIAGGANASYVTQMWTGESSNYGWIISNGSGSSTFASSYSPNSGWDYCNGSSNASSPIRLYYR